MYEFAYGAKSEKRLFEKSSPVSAAAGAAKMTVSATRTVHALMLVILVLFRMAVVGLERERLR
jgi:hypothetical protein